jgi:hypothetical protein
MMRMRGLGALSEAAIPNGIAAGESDQKFMETSRRQWRSAAVIGGARGGASANFQWRDGKSFTEAKGWRGEIDLIGGRHPGGEVTD